MLTKKHFVEFANFMVELKQIRENRLYSTTKEIDIKLADISERNGWHNVNVKSLDIDEVLQEEYKKFYNEIGSNIMFILDKNSLRFNQYMFKNYILAKSKKTDTKSTINS
tara:strand:- start:558 stop:887 length:330 start_codon:yes stop_codon:yes gene_type:complete